MELESLERAVEAAARDLDRDHDSSTLISLKAERDHKRKLLNSDWSHPDAEASPVLPH
jgi:DNA primase